MRPEVQVLPGPPPHYDQPAERSPVGKAAARDSPRDVIMACSGNPGGLWYEGQSNLKVSATRTAASGD
jgi:hypothetical protein